MKKWFALGLALLLTVMACCSAVAEEEFVLRNGITFGMTHEEVRKKESGIPNGLIFDYIGGQTVAGREDTSIFFDYDSKGGLRQMIYFFDDQSPRDYEQKFATTDESLAKKYGNTPYSSTTALRLPVIEKEEDVVSKNHKQDAYHAIAGSTHMISQFSLEGPFFEPMRFNNTVVLYSQWLIPYDNTYIIIEHSTMYRHELNTDLSDQYYERIIYTLLSKEESAIISKNLAPIDDGL